MKTIQCDNRLEVLADVGYQGGVYTVTVYGEEREVVTEAGEVRWEYAQHSFTAEAGEVDLLDVQQHPGAYLHFVGGAQARRLQAEYTAAVQRWMDRKVQERGYDSIFTACTYCGSTSERFRAEGEAALAWRDAVWEACYAYLAQAQAVRFEGVLSPEGLIGQLPTLVWPDEKIS